MNNLTGISISLAGALKEHAVAFLSLFSDPGLLPSAPGGGVTVALAPGAAGHGKTGQPYNLLIEVWFYSLI
jgi:hypothetical protein